MLCHGQGDGRVDAFDGGCCYVNGLVCPNRWFIDWASPEGEVLDSSRTSLGTVDDVARSFVGNNPNRRASVADAVQGVSFVCSAAVFAVADDPSLLNDRAAFEAAWELRPEYQPIADVWETIGRPRSWCMSYGPGEGQCCFGEDPATNDAKRAVLSTTAVTIRGSLNGAS